MMDAILDRCRWLGKRWLLLLGTVFGFLALVLAAIDQISAMIDMSAIALFFLGLSGVVAAYQHLPSAERERAFSKKSVWRAAVYSTLSGVAVASSFWFLSWFPWSRRVPSFIARYLIKLDWVPSLFSRVLPFAWRSGFHQYYRNTTYCFPGPFWWETMRYLRTAIIAYAFVFFLLACATRLVVATTRRWRGDVAGQDV